MTHPWVAVANVRHVVGAVQVAPPLAVPQVAAFAAHHVQRPLVVERRVGAVVLAPGRQHPVAAGGRGGGGACCRGGDAGRRREGGGGGAGELQLQPDLRLRVAVGGVVYCAAGPCACGVVLLPSSAAARALPPSEIGCSSRAARSTPVGGRRAAFFGMYPRGVDAVTGRSKKNGQHINGMSDTLLRPDRAAARATQLAALLDEDCKVRIRLLRSQAEDDSRWALVSQTAWW
jgi:hypothetical protein